MKFFGKIMLAIVPAFLLISGITTAQVVGSDGNLAYSISNYQADRPAENGSETFIIRNRLNSGICWTATAEALLMERTGGKSSSLLLNSVAQGGGEIFNSNGFYFPWAVGPRVSVVGEDILFGCDIEANYFGIDGWEVSKAFVAPAGARFMLFNQNAHTLTEGDLVAYRYISQLHSGEINARHPIWDRFSVLMGFRYLELHEVLMSAINSVQFAEANVDNHMYGGQIGANFALVDTCRFGIEGVVKAGVFGNYADLSMYGRDIIRSNQYLTHTSVFGEIGLTGIFQATNHLAVRGGYQAMWLDGVALASDQYESVTLADTSPYMGGTLFYHGVSAGLEYAF
jgi:hypothetical protein